MFGGVTYLFVALHKSPIDIIEVTPTRDRPDLKGNEVDFE